MPQMPAIALDRTPAPGLRGPSRNALRTLLRIIAGSRAADAPPTLQPMKLLLRYSLVGAIATAAHYALLIVCVEVGHWQAWAASGFGAIAGSQVAFFGNRRFTFDFRGGLGKSWLRFHVTAIAGAVLGMLIVGGAVRLGVHYLIGQILATLAGLLLTFAINRVWTFR